MITALGNGLIKTVKCKRSDDGSSKYILRLADGCKVQAVYIPQDDGTAKVCISSQVGCVNKCAYCATGMQQYLRDMTDEEIVAQLAHVLFKEQSRGALSQDLGVLFMGMGEPMFNYENIIAAIRMLETHNFKMSAISNIIVSTSGIVPGIVRFANEKPLARLAVSINAPNDSIRTSLMPINRVYPLKEVLSACNYYTSMTTKKVILEYVIIANVNDAQKHATEFAERIKNILCEIHLIPFNPHKRTRFQAPSKNVIDQFRKEVATVGLPVSLKPSYGTDVLGGCGQLSCSL